MESMVVKRLSASFCRGSSALTSCVCVCVCVCVIYTHARLYNHTTFTRRERAREERVSDACTHGHTSLLSNSMLYIHTYIHPYIHTCIHTCIHTYYSTLTQCMLLPSNSMRAIARTPFRTAFSLNRAYIHTTQHNTTHTDTQTHRHTDT
jgi:hypothetical protein